MGGQLVQRIVDYCTQRQDDKRQGWLVAYKQLCTYILRRPARQHVDRHLPRTDTIQPHQRTAPSVHCRRPGGQPHQLKYMEHHTRQAGHSVDRHLLRRRQLCQPRIRNIHTLSCIDPAEGRTQLPRSGMYDRGRKRTPVD